MGAMDFQLTAQKAGMSPRKYLGAKGLTRAAGQPIGKSNLTFKKPKRGSSRGA